jgi:hypothetical protein
MSIVIATDVDQVVVDFVRGWECCASRVLGREVRSLNREFPLNRRFRLPVEEANRVWEVFNTEEVWGNLPLYPDSVWALRRLQETGAEIHAVTSVPPKFLEARGESLRKSLPGILVHGAESLDPSKRNGFPSKEYLLWEIGPLFYADDRYPHCQEAVSAKVPHVYRVDGGHDGDGVRVPDVPVAYSLREALAHAGLLL